ncbi:hypothetical protein D6817_02575 [Candidatus Pacearchaeota archaeon]|nr:MAG: hypothetical protein D6817_02575 [Candidatus Pacearchaeota archaeon]
MKLRNLIKVLAYSCLIASNCNAGTPTLYNQPKPFREVVTKQIGKIDDHTQGVVTIYGADWCGPCNRLEHEIESSGLLKRLEKEGIVFRFIRNQATRNGKRVNEFIRSAIRQDTTFLKYVPFVVIDDLGRSYNGDLKEMAIAGLSKPEGLENYIRRYALDQDVHILTRQEALKVAEAIGSDLFKVRYGKLWQNGRKGFDFSPKDIHDKRTQEEIKRLQVIGNAVRIYDTRIIKEYKPKEIKSLRFVPTEEQIKRIRVEPEARKYYNDEIAYIRKVVSELNRAN